MPSSYPSVAVAGTLALLAQALGAQGPVTGTRPSHGVPRASTAIVVDAVLDEEAWRQALVLELAFEVRPGENVPPPVRTEVLITHDDEAVYFGFRAHDPDPSKIRAHLSNRDNTNGDDWVAVILDTFNDQRRSFDLIVNPLGVQTDFIETSNSSEEWDAIWDSAGRVTEWGYAVEIRLPFSSLRFQRTDGPQTWGFDAVRSYPRNVRHHIGVFPRDRSNNCYLCQAVTLEGFAGAEPGRSLEIVPTLTTTRLDERKEMPDGRLVKGGIDAEPGVTARWGLTPNLTLSGTLNPDFSQVEADALQIDVNEPFALFFPEKRPFFMEGSDFFSTRLNAVYTRTVRDPSWGIKLTGKEGEHTVGAYMTRDDLTNLLFPGTQSSDSTTLEQASLATVLRYKRDIGNRFTVGALFTNREGDGYANRVAGFDADLRFTDTDRLFVQVLGSLTRYPTATAEEFDQGDGELEGLAADVFFVHDTRNLDWWAVVREVGHGFRADLGFIPRVGYRYSEAGASYTWYPKGETWFSWLGLAAYLGSSDDHEGDLLHREAVVELDYEGPLQSHAFVRAMTQREVYEGVAFDKTELALHNCMSPANGTNFYVNLTLGDRIDYDNVRLGRRVRVGPGVYKRLGRHLWVDLDATWERMRVAGERLYDARVAQATVGYQFTTRAMLRTIVQYAEYGYNPALYDDGRDARERSLYSQILYSYTINPQTVLFLGYNDGAEASDDYGLTRTGRSIFAKVGYAWLP